MPSALNASISQYLFAHMPIYALHYTALVERGKALRLRLTELRAADVTWVYCADRDVVQALDATQRACIYPCTNPNLWFQGVMRNGTISLALKHKLAAYDLFHRHLPAALVIEDDAVFAPNFWSELMQLQIPSDCDVLLIGSYSKAAHYGTFKGFPLASSNVHARNLTEGGTRSIFGAVGYMLFHSGARHVVMSPVTAPADVALFGWHVDPCTGPDGRVHAPLPLARQYGPTRWLVWPSGAAGGTHYNRMLRS